MAAPGSGPERVLAEGLRLVLLASAFVGSPPLPGEPVLVPGGPDSVRRLLHIGDRRPGGDFLLDVNRTLLATSSPRVSWRENEVRQTVSLFAEDLEAWRAEQGCPAVLSTREDGWKRTRGALSWLGFDVRGDGPGFEVEPRPGPEAQRRQEFLEVLGLPVPGMIRRLSTGEDVVVECTDGEADLPLGVAAWRETLGVDEKTLNQGNAFLHFVRDVPASRMLVALQSVDSRTREEARELAGPAGGAKGWALLYREALDGFTRFPEALEIRDGRLRLPGGPEADPVWANVVGAPPSDRARFVVRLFTVDGGKPAYVVDALRQLPDAAARAFVLGRSRDGESAVVRFRRLYDAIERAGRSHERIQRRAYDFTHVARFLRFSDAGDLVVPGGAGVWHSALSGDRFPKNEAELSKLLDEAARRPVTAEEFIASLFGRELPPLARDVPAQARFLLVSGLVEARPVLADPGTVFLLARGLDRLQAAYAQLEDLPLDDPAVVRRYLFTLDRLDRNGRTRSCERAAGLFQAATELLAGFARSGALRESKGRELVSSLLDVPIFADPRPDPSAGSEALHRWIFGDLVSALREEEALFLGASRAEVSGRESAGGAPRPAPTPDDLFASALAGWRPPVTFAWRGGRYQFDPSADGAARRRAFAATQQALSLSGLEAAKVEREKALRAARDGDADAMRVVVSAFLERLSAARSPGNGDDARALAVVADARVAFGELQRTTNENALRELEERLGRFDALRAERTLEALVLHVYSSSAGDPADLSYSDALFTRRHALGWGSPDSAVTESPFGPTRLERLGEGKGMRIAGSFSGLPEVLGLLHLEQLVYGERGPVVSESVRVGLLAPVIRVTPARLDDDVLRFVAASCRATLQLAADLAAKPEAERLEAWSAATRGLVPPVRRNRLAAAPSEAAAYLTPSDLFRVGKRLALGTGTAGNGLPAVREAREAWDLLVSRLGGAEASVRLAEMGPRPLAWAGRSRLADLDMPAYERLSEYLTPSLFGDRLYDLKIAAARALVEAGDPAALLSLFLEPAVDELVRTLRMSYTYDWRPLADAEPPLRKASRDEVLERALADGRITRAEEGGPW